MTGNDRVLALLRDRCFHTTAEIERECEVTAHSRISDLRSAGHVIERKRNKGAKGRALFSYRLVQTQLERSLQDDELASLEEHGAAASCSSSDGVQDALLTVGAGEPADPASSLEPSSQGKPAAAAIEAAAGFDELGLAAAADPAAAGLDDAGWRELFPAGSFEPVQLPLLEGAV